VKAHQHSAEVDKVDEGEGQSSDRFVRMIPINLRLENKLISKNLIAALAPLPRVLGRYREARKSLRGSISRQSRQGLDWLASSVRFRAGRLPMQCGGNEA